MSTFAAQKNGHTTFVQNGGIRIWNADLERESLGILHPQVQVVCTV